MSNNNLPQEWADAFKQAGVSTDGWFLGAGETSMQYHTEPLHFEICISGALELWGCSDEPILVSTNGMSGSIQLADRLKRAIQQEPDPRVAELEAINKELRDALGQVLASVGKIFSSIMVVGEKPFTADFLAGGVRVENAVEQAKAALAKARGESK